MVCKSLIRAALHGVLCHCNIAVIGHGGTGDACICIVRYNWLCSHCHVCISSQLELLPDALPFYAKPFSIPKAYQQITKDKINCFESLGILTKIPSSEWAVPTFIIPKKNNSVCIITDFCGLNKYLKRDLYPMPKIPDMFNSMEQF